MGQIVYGVVGAAVGFFVGGPSGAQYGWMIGSAVGAVAGQEDQTIQGPRLGDKQVMSSTLGTSMPHLYGSWRLAGNVIDASDIREVESRTSESGKGGPEVVSINYTYNVDLAIDLCQAGALGIRKIWSDSKLIYDMGLTADAATLIASSVKAEGFTFYDGAEDQLPDPTLEALHGVDTPAYRGRSYIVFKALDCPQGRIPQLSFEVVTAGTRGEQSLLINTAPRPTTRYVGYSITKDVIVHVQEVIGAGVEVYLVEEAGVSFLHQLPLPAAPGAVGSVLNTGFRPMPGTTKAMVFNGDDNATNMWDVDLLTGRAVLITAAEGPTNEWSSSELNAAAFDPITEKYAFVSGGTSPDAAYVLATSMQPVAVASYTSNRSPVAAYSGVVYLLQVISSQVVLIRRNIEDGTAILTDLVGPASAAYSIQTSAIQADASGVWVSLSRSGGVDIYAIRDDEWVLLGAPNVSPIDSYTGEKTPTFYTNGSIAFLAAPTASEYYVVQLEGIDPDEYPISLIIEDQLEAAGVPAERIDASAVTDSVVGYLVSRVSSARANIEPLMKAFYIDGVDEDGVLRFTPRAAKTAVAPIAFDQLAATAGGDASGGPLPLSRAQEAEMPRTVTVNYVDVNSDYQPGSEQAIKQVTTSLNDMQVEIPIAINSDKARQIAEVTLFNTWSQRNTRSGSIDRTFAYLSPGDFVEVEYPEGVVSTKMLSRIGDDGAVLAFEAVDADAALYTKEFSGSVGENSQTVRPVSSVARAVVIDTSILRDQDDDAGVYVALGSAGTFNGAALFVGESNADLEAQGSVAVACAMGHAEGALGDFTLGILDEINTVTVQLFSGALASTTYDRVVNNIDNYCALGAPGRWELLQFRTATSLGGGRYTLSGLNRGRRGTEWATGLHAIGDSFVLLQAPGMLRPVFQVGEVTNEKLYVPVATGRSIETALRFFEALTLEGLKPHAPYDLRGSRSSNDLTMTWQRRTRYLDNWMLGVVPLGEATEAYSIDIFTSGAYTTVIRTLTSTSKTVTYTSAQQIADFGSNQATVYARVYQVSAAIDRGYPVQRAL